MCAYRWIIAITFQERLNSTSACFARPSRGKRSGPKRTSSFGSDSRINFLFKEEPHGRYPHHKIKEVVHTIAQAQPDGIVVFCAEQIEEFGVADALRQAFSEVG